MPRDPAGYVERLTVRPVWWVVALAVAIGAAAELAAGFDWRIGLIALAVALVPTVSVLAALSGLTVRVDERGLHAGRRTMTWDEMESVEGLSREETRLRAGPEADPAAYLAYRGYVGTAVLVRPMHAEPAPYWLVSTRHPDRVVAAVERAARASLSSS